MKYYWWTILWLFLAMTTAQAQMWNGRDTLYGNEWINYDQNYYRIPVAEDGLYRISATTLREAGLPVDATLSGRYRLFHLGREVTMNASAAAGAPLSESGYLEFYGEKNRSGLDRYLFKDPDAEMLNPYYSMFSDTAVYFLTIADQGTQGQRYEERPNNLTNLPAPEPWFWGTTEALFTEQHLKQYTRISGVSIFYTHFDVAEGFGSRSSNDLLRKRQRVQEVELPLPHLYPGGPAAQLEARYACGLGDHQQEVRVEGTLVAEESFTGFQVRELETDLPQGLLDGRNKATVAFQGKVPDGQEEQSLAMVRLRYPRAFDFDNAASFTFELAPSSQRRYLEINQFDTGGGQVRLFDLTSATWLRPETDGDRLRIALPASPETRRFLLVNETTGVREVEALSRQEFVDYGGQNADYLIISDPALYGGATNQVQAYADYRASAAGGSYRPAIVEVQQIYDQFGYGVARHAQAIRNFGHFLRKNWPQLRFVLLIGKGREYPDVRTGEQLQQAAAGGTFYVPSFGYPASDHMLFSGNDTSIPLFAVGRIAANDPSEIDIYLRKVKEQEENRDRPQTIADKAWMKRVIHLGGGGSASEQQLIRNYLERMGGVIVDSTFGANLVSYYKTSTEPLQTSVFEQIFTDINDGASMLTFFGHSSPGTFDFNIDNPNNYKNKGKYPMMISLGCYSGNLFTDIESTSERFCFYEDRGAIAFGASRGLGFISALYQFAEEYYRIIGGVHYGTTIGEGLRETVRNLNDRGGIGITTLVEQFTLHGDPALRLFPAPGPDYIPDPGSWSFEPRVVTAQQDSFTLQFDLLNIGRNEAREIAIAIEQQLPNGERRLVRKDTVVAPGYRKTLAYRLPNAGREAVGRNVFFIEVDADDSADEAPAPAAEQNNELVRASGEPGIPLFIIDNAARPIFPQNYGIVNQADGALTASTTNGLAPEQTYVLQLDTTARFNSGLLQSERITTTGGLIRWKPAITLRPDEVYYWRISPDSLSEEVGYVWESRSFTYLPDEPEGWNQQDYWQYLDGETYSLTVQPGNRFEFGEVPVDIRVKNEALAGPETTGATYFTNGQWWANMWIWDVSSYRAGVQIAVLDPTDPLLYWINHPPGEYGSINKKSFWVPQFSFPTATAEDRAKLIRFLRDEVPNGHYVVFYTGQASPDDSFASEEWSSDQQTGGADLFSLLEAQGAAQVRELESGSKPYVFFYQKGEGPLQEAIADDLNSVIDLVQSIPQFLTSGQLTSPVIGPAKSWRSLKWKGAGRETPDADTAFVTLYGLDEDMQETLLRDSIFAENLDLDFVSPRQYPYLRMQYHVEDNTNRTPVQLSYWRVLYEGFPDAAVNPNAHFTVSGDTIATGEAVRLEVAVENASSHPLDSLLVQYTITGNGQQVWQERYRPLAPGDTLHAHLDLPSQDLNGRQQLVVELNPGPEQAESYYFNNFLFYEFLVGKDAFNPLLDVTFDGTHIMDGDLVSARPEILITLEDENQYLALQDTALFDVLLTYPDGTTRTLDFSAENVLFTPATTVNGDKNKATVLWMPELEADGTYTLVVQARDVSGNAAGQYAFRRAFEVINARTITNVVNYPNPFSTSTHFVYTLTGDGPPIDFKIQILTVSGRVVRELTQADLGPLQVGTHRTPYAWDGTDEFGDQLANGIYLYRVVTRDEEGQEYETRESGIDRFFKKGFGKLVILR